MPSSRTSAPRRRIASPCATVLTALFLLSARDSVGGDAALPYVIEPGQTLWSVAYAHGLSVEDLMRINAIADPTTVRAGQSLVLPEGHESDEAPVTSWAEPPPNPELPALTWPLHGALTSLYGRRGHGLHSGLDIAAPKGTIIAAAARGRVVRAGKGWGRYGKVVLIDHGNGLTTLYAHTSRVFVKEGQAIRQGQAIAAVGRSGNATGFHLHFEVWGGDRTLDPLRLLAGSEHRLSLLLSGTRE